MILLKFSLVKIKKELVLSLAPYREKINNGEKYEKVVLKLLESLPEYVNLREIMIVY